MKSAWKRQVKSWQLKNLGENLTKKTFPGVFKAAWESVATLENAAHGFKRAGLFPLDPAGVDDSKLAPSQVVNPCNTAVVAPVKPANNKETAIVLSDKTANNTETTVVVHEEAASSTNATIDASEPSAPITADVPVLASSPTEVQTNLLKTVNTATVSPAFEMLNVPEPKKRLVTKKITEKLPKAVSGTKALKMLRDKEAKRAADLLAKMQRKQERERKKIEREELKERKRIEREEMQRKKKGKKLEKKHKRKRDSSSSSDDNAPVKVMYADSDESYDESLFCPGCRTDDGDSEEWLQCTICHMKWHITCTGETWLFEIPKEQVENYPFRCEKCM